ncbi:hypothetical protein MKK88_07475 [Methylobacterium sp. E-005]|uniref:hypothetical protein n=1 Tax=Methylobacterium sp. E-005 TaxID=2836549 RepID=UPI001FBAD34A|nr:hypothetical protein [Methylobacterium sp. E-005]MCJ2085832.1 hypothetical protein [Methylobacterium sp. E-005]
MTAHVGQSARSSQRQGAISATMAAGQLTVADLRKAGRITSHEIVAAIDAYLRDPAAVPYLDAIAARAGVCRRLAQAAIRLAEGDGLLTIQERRHQGRKSDPNVVRIISREWLQWLRRSWRSAAPALLGGIGCKTMHPTDRGDPQRQVVDAEAKKSCRGATGDLVRSDPVRIVAGGRTARAMQ